MTVSEFAAQFRVKTRLDSCGEQIIPGKPYKEPRPEDRNQIFDYGDDEHFGVSLLLRTARQWASASKRLLIAGMTVMQSGDTEGTLLFDPTNVSSGRPPETRYYTLLGIQMPQSRRRISHCSTRYGRSQAPWNLERPVLPLLGLSKGQFRRHRLR